MANSSSPGSSQLKSDALLEQMKLHFATDAGKALTEKINLVYQLNIAPKKLGFNEEIYVVDLKKGEVTKGSGFCYSFDPDVGMIELYISNKAVFTQRIGSIQFHLHYMELVQSDFGHIAQGPYEGGKPDATFSFTDENFLKVATGKMNPQIAFMRGAMKIKGSISAAQKFTPDIFPKPSKM